VLTAERPRAVRASSAADSAAPDPAFAGGCTPRNACNLKASLREFAPLPAGSRIATTASSTGNGGQASPGSPNRRQRCSHRSGRRIFAMRRSLPTTASAHGSLVRGRRGRFRRRMDRRSDLRGSGPRRSRWRLNVFHGRTFRHAVARSRQIKSCRRHQSGSPNPSTERRAAHDVRDSRSAASKVRPSIHSTTETPSPAA